MAECPATLRAALAGVAGRLQAAGIERGRAEARLIVGHALGLSPEAVVGNDQRLLASGEWPLIDRLASRRAAREPMSQVLGYREFYGRRFAVSSAVLTPRPDSETLIEAVLKAFPARDEPLQILDLGTGTGCLLLTLLAEFPRATGYGVDCSAEALSAARTNAAALHLTPRTVLHHSDWTAGISRRFDLVISNPPYIPSGEIAALDPEVALFEPLAALDGGVDGLDFYRRLAVDLPRLLNGTGIGVVELGAGQAEAVVGMFEAAGLTPRQLLADLAGINRCVVAALR